MSIPTLREIANTLKTCASDAEAVTLATEMVTQSVREGGFLTIQVIKEICHRLLWHHIRNEDGVASSASCGVVELRADQWILSEDEISRLNAALEWAGGERVNVAGELAQRERYRQAQSATRDEWLPFFLSAPGVENGNPDIDSRAQIDAIVQRHLKSQVE